MKPTPGLVTILLSVQSLCVTIIAWIALFGGPTIAGLQVKSVAPWAALLWLAFWIARRMLPEQNKSGFLLRPFGVPLGDTFSETTTKPQAFQNGIKLLLLFAFLSASAFGIMRIIHFQAGVFDAGFVFQSIFQGFESPLLRCDVCMRDSYLGEHQSWTFLLLTPLAKLFGSPLVFPVFLAGFGIGSLVLLLRRFKHTLSPTTLLYLVLALFCVRGFRNGFLYDFREDVIGCFFLVLGILAHLDRRYLLAYPAFLLAVLSKETVAILLPFTLGALYFYTPDRRRLAFDLAFALAAFVLTFYVFMPYWRAEDGASSNLVNRIGYLGSTPKEIFENLIRHPISSLGKILGDLLSAANLRYFVYTVLPFLPLMLLNWNPIYTPGLVLALGNMISRFDSQQTMQFHYETLMIPYFAIGMAISLTPKKGKPRISPFARSSILALFLLVSGTWPMVHDRGYWRDFERISDYTWLREKTRSLPPSSILLADSESYPIVTTHPRLRALLNPTFQEQDRPWLGSGRLGESTHAVLAPDRAKAAFGEGFERPWKELECSPRKKRCLYLRIPEADSR